MVLIKRKKVVEIVLLICIVLWSIISTVSFYLSSFRANNSEQFAQKTARMTQYVIEMAQEFAEIAQEWKGLAYQLNPEAAEVMEKRIQEYYQNKEQQEGKQKQKELWT